MDKKRRNTVPFTSPQRKHLAKKRLPKGQRSFLTSLLLLSRLKSKSKQRAKVALIIAEHRKDRGKTFPDPVDVKTSHKGL